MHGQTSIKTDENYLKKIDKRCQNVNLTFLLTFQRRAKSSFKVTGKKLIPYHLKLSRKKKS